MFSIHLLQESGFGFEAITWTVLGIFFLMVILGWLVASRGWLKEDQDSMDDPHREEHGGHDENAAG
jgi:hypothetical protein